MLSTTAWKAASSAMVCSLMLAAATPAVATEADRKKETRQEQIRICVGTTSEIDEHVFAKKTMEAEVNAIWAQYGIKIEGLTAPCSGSRTGRPRCARSIWI